MRSSDQRVEGFIDPVELGLEIAQRAGHEYIVRCPFHDDGHPSASFNPSTGMLFCFSCGAWSDAQRLAYLLGGQVNRKPPTRRSHVFEDWRSFMGSPAVNSEYLLGRGVRDLQINRWRISEIPGAVVFPVTDARNRDVGVIVRRHSGTPRYLFFGEKPPLWPLGWLATRPSGSVIYLVEGVFGRLRAERAGIPAVAVMGASVNPLIGDYLRRFKVRVLFDDDYAGYAGAGKLLSILPSATVIVPGMEADELSNREWRQLDQDVTNRKIQTTHRISVLSALSGDPRRYQHQVIRRAMRTTSTD